MSDPECPDCRRTMKEGFLLDRGDHNRAQATRWVDGRPERSFWFGIRLRGKRQYPVASWRCESCGTLKLRATEPVD